MQAVLSRQMEKGDPFGGPWGNWGHSTDAGSAPQADRPSPVGSRAARKGSGGAGGAHRVTAVMVLGDPRVVPRTQAVCPQCVHTPQLAGRMGPPKGDQQCLGRQECRGVQGHCGDGIGGPQGGSPDSGGVSTMCPHPTAGWGAWGPPRGPSSIWGDRGAGGCRARWGDGRAPGWPSGLRVLVLRGARRVETAPGRK